MRRPTVFTRPLADAVLRVLACAAPWWLPLNRTNAAASPVRSAPHSPRGTRNRRPTWGGGW